MARMVAGVVLSAWLVLLPTVLAAQDVGEDMADACSEAKQDAETHVSKVGWLAIGCLTMPIGVGIALIVRPNPPAERLVGKSPEYVEAYTRCYASAGKGIQLTWSTLGCASGVLFWAGTVVMISAASGSCADAICTGPDFSGCNDMIGCFNEGLGCYNGGSSCLDQGAGCANPDIGCTQ